MNKLSIDLDAARFYNMMIEQMEEEFKLIRDIGISAINIDYKIFLDNELEMFKNNLLSCISYNKMQIILRASEIEGYYTDYDDEEHLQKSLVKHKQFLYNINKDLEDKEIKTNVKVIFTGSRCLEGDTQKTLERDTRFFKELSSSVEHLKIEILTEVQGAKPTKGRVIGDIWSDFEYLCKNIPNKNWGICWSTGNSRMNFVEYNEELTPSKEVLDRVKIANIRNNISQNFDISLYNNEVQEQEIKSLIMNGYEGVFNLEYVYAYLEYKNVPYHEVYDSVYYLRCVLNYFIKQNNVNGLEVIDDISRMNRHSIRTIIKDNIKITIDKLNHEFDKLEIATHSLKVWSREDLVLEDIKENQIEICVRDEEKFVISAKFMMTREENEQKGYVFKILNKDTETIKKIYRLVYLMD